MMSVTPIVLIVNHCDCWANMVTMGLFVVADILTLWEVLDKIPSQAQVSANAIACGFHQCPNFLADNDNLESLSIVTKVLLQ